METKLYEDNENKLLQGGRKGWCTLKEVKIAIITTKNIAIIYIICLHDFFTYYFREIS